MSWFRRTYTHSHRLNKLLFQFRISQHLLPSHSWFEQAIVSLSNFELIPVIHWPHFSLVDSLRSRQPRLKETSASIRIRFEQLARFCHVSIRFTQEITEGAVWHRTLFDNFRTFRQEMLTMESNVPSCSKRRSNSWDEKNRQAVGTRLVEETTRDLSKARVVNPLFWHFCIVSPSSLLKMGWVKKQIC